MSGVNRRWLSAIQSRDKALDLMQRLSNDSISEGALQWNAALIEMQQKALESHWSSFQTFSIKLSSARRESILQCNQTKMVVASELYENVKQQLEALLRECDPVRFRPLPKVSEIILEKFDGNFTCWTAWRSRFKSAVLDTQLPAGTKIDLLLSALEGEARNCAGDSVHRDEDEINRMWYKLEQTYDNPYQIITAHISKILDLPSCERQDYQIMQDMINVCDQELRSLKRFGYDVESWSPLLAIILLRKLDRSSRSFWEMNREPTKPPELDAVLLFMKRRISCSLNQNQNAGCSSSKDPNAVHLPQKRTNFSVNDTSMKRFRAANDRSVNNKESSLNNSTSSKQKPFCEHCKGDHKIFRCEKFSKFDLPQRLAKISEYQLCEVCLSRGHSSNDCSWNGCKNCNNAKHNRIICPKFPVMRVMHVRPNKSTQRSNKNQVMNVSVRNAFHSQSVDPVENGLSIIGTALFKINQGDNSSTGDIRALCDSGSQLNLITEDCVQRWKLNRKQSKLEVIGLALDNPILSSGFVDAIIMHRSNSSVMVRIRFVVVSKITCHNPQQRFTCPLDSQLDAKELADPTFSTPGKIDALIGINTWSSIIQQGLIKCFDEGRCFVAQQSLLGWVIFGYTDHSEPSKLLCFESNDHYKDFDVQLERLWKIDEQEDNSRQLSADELRAEDIFVSTRYRDDKGRYVVTIPFRENVTPLGYSRQTALNRYIALEKRLNKRGNEEKLKEFKEFMDDYIKSKHLILASPSPKDPSHSYYIPYHIIHKKKMRVVFDASCKTSSGISLNDQQLTGAKLQPDLCETMLLFRTYKFALTADIVKMFRQVSVHPSQYNFQRIFYRPSSDEEIKEYFITQVIWGFTSAGFNAVRALQQCAVDGDRKYPLAAAATMENFYIDDFLSGADSIEELQILRQQMIDLLRSGGFELAKWATSHPLLSKEINQTDNELVIHDEMGVLGMGWNSKSDSFHIKVNAFKNENFDILTKRQIISHIAQVYDPTGLFTPIIVIEKIIIQEIWKLNPRLEWDQKVPDTIISQFHKFQQNVKELASISIPRWLACTKDASIELHVFSDASIQAYGACVYIRSTIQCQTTTRLITSRNKVAPIKTQSIPRLELMAAEMGTQLAVFVSKACKFENVRVYFWSDSTIVLHWLNRNVATLKPFVGNRISKILKSSKIGQWNHVPGSQNPADLVSRGCSTRILKESSLRWNGPEWLKLSSDYCPKFPGKTLSSQDIDADKEESKPICIVTHINRNAPNSLSVYNDGKPQSIEQRASSLNKIIRVTAFIFRFIENIKVKQHSRSSLNIGLNNHKMNFFHSEIKSLKEDQDLATTSTILQLNPFIDSNGIMGVGGRLGRSSLPNETKHQIILHHSAAISSLIIKNAHNKVIHGGTQLTMNHVRQQYWITRLRPLTKKIINVCINCVRYKKENVQQLMGALPSIRINQTFPFCCSGVDFAGPFEIRKTVAPTMTLRNKNRVNGAQHKPQTIKCWVVVFVCLSTRAVHIDITHGLTVEAFMEVFSRFISRRGQCKVLWSDNGTNFVGSNKEIQRVLKEWSGKLPEKELANYGTAWRFITPSAPHQGGLWEASIKSTKHHLKRAIGRRVLSSNQLYTILTQIESCLNSRPLTPLNDDPSDFEALTPAHFLIGRSTSHQPTSEDVTQWNDNRLTLWGQQQKIYQSFWRRWKDEYLISLQKRVKWSKIKANLKKGDMVIINNNNLPPAFWSIGRVKEVHPGEDGLVRNVTVSTHVGDFLRPIQKLILLPV